MHTAMGGDDGKLAAPGGDGFGDGEQEALIAMESELVEFDMAAFAGEGVGIGGNAVYRATGKEAEAESGDRGARVEEDLALVEARGLESVGPELAVLEVEAGLEEVAGGDEDIVGRTGSGHLEDGVQSIGIGGSDLAGFLDDLHGGGIGDPGELGRYEVAAQKKIFTAKRLEKAGEGWRRRGDHGSVRGEVLGEVLEGLEAERPQGVGGVRGAGSGRVAAEAGEGGNEAGIDFGFFVELIEQGGGVEAEKDLPKLGSGEGATGVLEGGLGVGVEEFLGEFEAGVNLVEEELLAEPVLVAAVFPSAEVVFAEVGGVRAEAEDDFGVGEAVLEQEVNLVADGLGEACDFAKALARWFGVGDGGGSLGFGEEIVFHRAMQLSFHPLLGGQEGENGDKRKEKGK